MFGKTFAFLKNPNLLTESQTDALNANVPNIDEDQGFICSSHT